MEQTKNTNRGAPAEAAAGPQAGGGPAVGLDLIVKEVLAMGAARARALWCLHVHARKVRAAARELAAALAESRDVWNWPGDRLPVGDEMSQHVEKLTHRLRVETDAHHRLEGLFKTVGRGRSVQAV
ncbi:hypothetical protein [Pseudarthrobacter chlorophenolicus]|uniref:hypothetical protein n=1 Tax=Pseudarthrobacter chlorophenolicus TaxID=85085 RepID=UPI000ABD3F02|nr:hypothetical protein [Pseudarthrobacter chlorophenolicus]